MSITLFVSIIIAGTLIGIGVHLIPVGGAPAALSTTAGVPTGAPMITMGMGITGLLAVTVIPNSSLILVLATGAVGSMMMIGLTMLFSNIVHIYGVGCPPSSANFEVDPITHYSQEEYVSPGTTGHGIPTVSFISGVIGAAFGGLGGSLAFYSIYNTINVPTLITGTSSAVSIAAILSLVIFFIIAVVASYNIGGTIQGFYDKKFKDKILPGTLSCFLISVIISVIYVVITGGLI